MRVWGDLMIQALNGRGGGRVLGGLMTQTLKGSWGGEVGLGGPRPTVEGEGKGGRLGGTSGDQKLLLPPLLLPQLLLQKHDNALRRAKWANFGYTVEQEGDR